MTETVRYTIETTPDERDDLAVIAKQYKLSQGEIIGCLLRHFDREAMAPVFTAQREAKVAVREDNKKIKKLVNSLRSLDPEQIAELHRLANEK